MVYISLKDMEEKVKKEIKTELVSGGESKLKCNYGCGQEAKHKISNGKLCCSKYPIQCPAVRYKKHGKIDPEDYQLQIKCDCLYTFVVRKSEARNVCPHCGRSGTFIWVRQYIETK